MAEAGGPSRAAAESRCARLAIPDLPKALAPPPHKTTGRLQLLRQYRALAGQRLLGPLRTGIKAKEQARGCKAESLPVTSWEMQKMSDGATPSWLDQRCLATPSWEMQTSLLLRACFYGSYAVFARSPTFHARSMHSLVSTGNTA
eukprot:6178575-Pleurochrysis_carterae.AAC.14